MDKIIVSGSRGIDDYKTVRDAIVESPFPDLDIEIVHGGADGVDSLASEYAERSTCTERVFEADWDEYRGNSAGPIRNAEMAEYGDALVAVWDGESNGTNSMIDQALNQNIPIYVKTVEVDSKGVLDY